MKGHGAVVVLRCRLHAPQVVAAVGVVAGQAVCAQFHGLGAVILEAEHHTAALVIDGHPQQPLFGVRLCRDTLDGVVQRRAHEGAQLPGRQEPQLAAIGHAGHVDAPLLAVHALCGEQGVQHRIAGLVLGLIPADAAFHPGQRGVLLGPVALGTDVCDLNFQLMVAAVDEPDALFAPLVLLILAVEHLVHRRKLAVEGRLPQLLVLDGQDEDAADVHQRADVVDAHVHLAVAQEQQVAHREDHRRHDDGHEARFSADDDMALGTFVLMLQHPDAAENAAIDHHQKQQ